MQKLPGTGKVKNIGVSNFAIKNLEILLKNPELKITPAVNQVRNSSASATCYERPSRLTFHFSGRAPPQQPLPQAGQVLPRKGHSLHRIFMPGLNRLASLQGQDGVGSCREEELVGAAVPVAVGSPGMIISPIISYISWRTNKRLARVECHSQECHQSENREELCT